jgi:alkylhydroperoxidase family enzyme
MVGFRVPELPPESKGILEKVVPPPYQPPLLYLAMGANPAVLRAYAEGPLLGLRGLLHTGQLDPADRELAILRVTGRCGAEHEWGVHVAYFGKTSGLTDSQVAATVTDADPTPTWTERQRAIIAVADAIVDRRPFTEDEAALIDSAFTDAERIEFLALSSAYLGIAALCEVLQIPCEPGAPAMPLPG